MSHNIPYPKKHFRGQTEDEQVIVFIRKHWIVLLKFFFYTFLATLLFISNIVVLILTVNSVPLESAIPTRIYITITTLLLIIFIAYIFTNFINYYLDIIIITNLRVVEIKKTIFFKNKVQALEIKNIQEIKADKEGFIANSLSFGNIILSSPTNNYERILATVPTPHYYADIITRLKHGNIIKNADHTNA